MKNPKINYSDSVYLAKKKKQEKKKNLLLSAAMKPSVILGTLRLLD